MSAFLAAVLAGDPAAHAALATLRLLPPEKAVSLLRTLTEEKPISSPTGAA